MVSEHLASEVSKNVRDMLLLPPIPFGMSAHYSGFPLAISLKTETLMRMLHEIFDSLRKNGLNRLLIINGHDGNIPAIDAVTNEYRAEFPEFKIAVFSSWWVTAGQLVPEGTFEVWGGLGHGGEGETSMMLHVDPSLVDMRKAQGNVPDLPTKVEIKWLFHEITPYGVTGDPSKANQEKGKLMNDAMVNLLVNQVQELDEKNWEISLN
jgi:creatinine amidohydrolase